MRTFTLTALLTAAFVLGGCTAGRMNQEQYDSLRTRADATVATFRAKHADRIDGAAGYAVFPTVGKGGFAGFSLGFGRGLVYAEGEPIGVTGFNAANIGFTLGGQAYEQILLLHTPADVEKFTGGPWTGAAQANAVFGPWGASADADFRSGQELITEDIWGLMYEATIGLDKYNYRSLDRALKTDETDVGGDGG
jgi:lipid-binding SYLF domain-containing protein